MNLTRCWKHSPRSFSICSVCSLHNYFYGFIIAFQIGSSLVGTSLVKNGNFIAVKKSMTFRRVLKEPEHSFSIFRSFTRLALVVNPRCINSLQEGLVSSIQAHSCLTLLHLNYNRAGLSPIGLLNLYTWGFGLLCCREYQ